MELLLIRHSITPGNLKKQFMGSTDQPLAPEGEELARSKQAAMPPVEAVWVSPLLRCRQTAQLLFPDMPPVAVPDLRECNFGEFEGKTWQEIQDHPAFQAWVNGDRTVVLPGGEATDPFFARCRRGMRQVVEQSHALGIQRGAVVAHGGTQMAVLGLLSRPVRDYYRWMAPNGGGYILKTDAWEGERPLELVREVSFTSA